MKNIIVLMMTLVVGLGFVIGCGPSEEEKAAAAEAERVRQEEQAARQTKMQAAREAAQAKAKEEGARRDTAATEAVQTFLKKNMEDPSVKPRKYHQAMTSIEVKGGTLTAAISISDGEEAKKFCNFLLNGWWEREEYGIGHVQVVHSSDGHVMAKQVRLDNGFETCK